MFPKQLGRSAVGAAPQAPDHGMLSLEVPLFFDVKTSFLRVFCICLPFLGFFLCFDKQQKNKKQKTKKHRWALSVGKGVRDKLIFAQM